jgi:D-alanine transaminase
LDQIAYVNGAFVALAEAKVSILDRGFLFADGIYEVTAVLDGRLIDNASHLARLERSVGEIALALPETLERIQEIQKQLIARNHLINGSIYLEVTRGADTARDFTFPKGGVRPTLIMFAQFKDIVNAPLAKRGMAVITVPDIRWARRDIKSVALLAQVLAKQAAAKFIGDPAGLHPQGGGRAGRRASAARRGAAFQHHGGAGGQGGLRHQRHPVRAGGGVDRRKDHSQRQAGSDDGPPARDLHRFRPQERWVNEPVKPH